MPGKNLSLKPGQILFSKGDASDGMYLVRRGELQVYLEQQGREVTLANVGDGGMIGEMALFDQQPRSASVKAISASEVTQITNEDFRKLLKQIPRWFTSLMVTLSGRLRATNERLEKTEARKAPAMEHMQNVLRILHIIELIWHRDGIKEGKAWTIEQETLISQISTIFSEDAAFVSKVIEVLIQEGLFGRASNSYGSALLSLGSRGNLRIFLDFFSRVLKHDGYAVLPDAAMDLLQAAASAGEQSAYEKFSASLSDLAIIGHKLHLKTSDEWESCLSYFRTCDRKDFEVIRASAGPGIQSNKKSIQKMLKFHSTIRKLSLQS
ncbi:MAG: Crp/Fnr family transcriptional regulator [Deltaproteobacteria bacterium]|nr:Crp/Fnr family transcriptional regulator [Deltaproteobacteria bacterium]